MSKVNKKTLEQCPVRYCSNAFLLTLNMYLLTGKACYIQKDGLKKQLSV